MTRARQIVIAATIVSIIAVAFAVFRSPTSQKSEHVIAPVSGPSR